MAEGKFIERLFLDHGKTSGVVLHIGDLRVGHRDASGSALVDQKSVAAGDAKAKIGNTHVLHPRFRQRAGAVLAVASDDRQSIRETVLNLHVADLETGNIAAIETNLQRAAPAPHVIETTAANQHAIANHRSSAEIVVDLPVLVRSRESRTEKDAARRRDVRQQTILNDVAESAVHCGALGEKRRLRRAVADHIIARASVLNIVLIGSGWPDGETIVTGATGAAVFDHRSVDSDAEIDAVGEQIAEPAPFETEPCAIVDPRARLGVFDPDTSNA